jgi:UPF0755 protein
MNRFLVFLGILVLVAGAAAGYGAWRLRTWLHTPVRAAAPVVVVIPPGASFRGIAGRLARAGVVDQPLLLRAWARYSKADRGVHSGEFLFDRALTPLEVLDKLHGSESFPRRVTIPEGLTARQVGEVLEEAGLGGRDVYRCVMRSPALLAEFALPSTGIEGYLFPDTYDFEPGTPPEAVVRRMLERFREVSAELAERREAAGMSEEEMVILAAVIEKETGAEGERPRVAGVFHNRLRKGMKLQSDPTIIYGRDGEWSRPITRSDLADPHPYNTYAHPGLPPGPIANPGRAALAAAVSPAETDALYFVSRNDGTHVFSRTLRAHNREVRKYQR